MLQKNILFFLVKITQHNLVAYVVNLVLETLSNQGLQQYDSRIIL